MLKHWSLLSRSPSFQRSFLIVLNCDILRRAAEAGGLLVDAMINIQKDLKEDLPSVSLMVVENGCSSPCIDLRQVRSELAAAARDADLIILEGMGRAIHTISMQSLNVML